MTWWCAGFHKICFYFSFSSRRKKKIVIRIYLWNIRAYNCEYRRIVFFFCWKSDPFKFVSILNKFLQIIKSGYVRGLRGGCALSLRTPAHVPTAPSSATYPGASYASTAGSHDPRAYPCGSLLKKKTVIF